VGFWLKVFGDPVEVVVEAARYGYFISYTVIVCRCGVEPLFAEVVEGVCGGGEWENDEKAKDSDQERHPMSRAEWRLDV
jgi:hypothetical protein